MFKKSMFKKSNKLNKIITSLIMVVLTQNMFGMNDSVDYNTCISNDLNNLNTFNNDCLIDLEVEKNVKDLRDG